MAKWFSLSVSGDMGEKSVKCDICGKYEDDIIYGITGDASEEECELSVKRYGKEICELSICMKCHHGEPVEKWLSDWVKLHKLFSALAVG